MSDAPLQLHLPQAILRVYIAETEQRVRLVGREDVRNRVGVANDVDRCRESGDGNRAVDVRQRAAQVVKAAGEHEHGQHQDRRERFQQHATHACIIIKSQLSTHNYQLPSSSLNFQLTSISDRMICCIVAES